MKFACSHYIQESNLLALISGFVQGLEMGDGDVKTENAIEPKIEENGISKSPPASRQRAEKKLHLHKIFLPDSFKTYVVDSTKAFDNIVKLFRRDIQDFKILSVDSESTHVSLASSTNSTRSIDLLQIGTLGGRAFLFRLGDFYCQT